MPGGRKGKRKTKTLSAPRTQTKDEKERPEGKEKGKRESKNGKTKNAATSTLGAPRAETKNKRESGRNHTFAGERGKGTQKGKTENGKDFVFVFSGGTFFEGTLTLTV